MSTSKGSEPDKEMQVRYESGLRPGHKVRVRWDDAGKQQTGRATILMIRPLEIQVELDEIVRGRSRGGSFPYGTKINVPRCKLGQDNGWSLYNGVFALEEN